MKKFGILLTSIAASYSLAPTTYAASPLKISVEQSFYPTAGQPFVALPLPTGELITPVVPYDNASNSTQILGIEVFKLSNGNFTEKCVLPAPSDLKLSQIIGLDLYPGGNYVGTAVVGAPEAAPYYNGLLMLKTSDILACSYSSPSVFITQYIEGQLTSIGTGDVQFNSAGNYAFVRNEYGGPIDPKGHFGTDNEMESFAGNVGVTRLAKDASGNITNDSKLLSEISSGGRTISGVTLSRDGTRLYVSSEEAPNSPTYAGSKNKILTSNSCKPSQGNPPQKNGPGKNGLLTVIDVAKAEAGLGAQAIISQVNAACVPTRIIESTDGSTIFVAARSSNKILAFNKALLDTNPDEALIGTSSSYGQAPVGLGILDNGTMLAVANSNRYNTSKDSVGNLTILDIRNPKKIRLVKTLPAGQFPRDINIGNDGKTVYLADYGNSGPTNLNTGIGVYTINRARK